MAELIGVPAEQIGAVWRVVAPYIFRACARSNGRHTPETIFQGLLERDLQLWLVVDRPEVVAVVVTEIVTYRTGMKACSILIVTGVSRKQWVNLVEHIEEWAAANGCKVIQAMARPGWERSLPEWKRTHVFLEKSLEN